MRNARRLMTVALAAFGVLAFSSAPAWAGNGYEKVTGTFGSGPCKVTSLEPCDGKFNEPTSIAVNNATEDVYVVDSGNDRIEYFSFNATTKAHEYAGQFNGSGEDTAVEGKAAGSGSGEKLTGKFLEPGDIAVDNDPLSPSHGDVYVADVGHEAIDKFSATGKYEGQLTGSCENVGEAEPCSGSKLNLFSGLVDVAVDSSGDVWVYEADIRQIDEFEDTGILLEKDGNMTEAGRADGFAVDSNGNAYVKIEGASTKGTRINEYEKGTGTRTIVTEYGTPSATLAIISSTNDLLIDEGPKIELFKSPIEGNLPVRTFPSEGLSESAGIAVNGAEGEGTIYATQRVADDVDVLESEPAKAPEIVSVSPSSVETSVVEFSAVINPENSETTYSIEYSTEGSTTGNTLAGTIETVTGEPPLLAEFGEQTVRSPEVVVTYPETYYYRIVASNKLGTATSKVQAYTKLPLIENEKVSNLTSTSTDLEATVNPLFDMTEYAFEFANEAARLGTSEATILGKSEVGGEIGTPSPVSAEITGLQPGHTYYYRVVAENPVSRYAKNANEGKPVHGEIKEVEPYAPPAVTTGEAQNITRTAATFSGAVDPKGTETKYYFAYIGEAGFQEALKKGAANPYAEGETTVTSSLPASGSPQAVGPIPASGLLPGETYHYALVAVNKFAIQTIGPDRTFQAGDEALPIVSTGGASGVSQNAATLSGTVSTNGLQTNYGFEIGTQVGNYGPATGLGSIGGAATEEVHVTLGELQPGTTYYYRITATNGDGTETGQPASFTTPGFPTLISPPASPPLIATPSIAFPKEEKGSGITTKTLTKAEDLAKALEACKKDHSKSKRQKCEKQAHSRYGAAKKAKPKLKK